MLSYILKRLILMVPTLLLVSIVVYGLSELAIGDSLAIRLSQQGIDPDRKDYLASYEKLYMAEGHHKPAFYLTMRPQYVTIPVASYANPLHRGFVSALVEERYGSVWAAQLLESLLVIAKTDSDMAPEVHRWLAKAEVSYIADKATEQGYQHIMQLCDEAYVHNMHYPVLRWHGSDNRYHQWLSEVARGSFGYSKSDGQLVADKIWTALRWTLLILILNIMVTLTLSVPYGLYTGMHVDSLADRWSGVLLFAVFAMPTFWLATMLVMLFTTGEYGMHIFPAVGSWYGGIGQSFFDMVLSKWSVLVIPISILVVKDIAYLGRMIRDTVATESTKQYALTARAKGIGTWPLAVRHILPNALGPAITLAVGAIPGALGGSLLLEVIFNIPGMGRLMYTAIGQADWPVVYPIVLLTAVVTAIWYLIGDVLVAILNPKIKL